MKDINIKNPQSLLYSIFENQWDTISVDSRHLSLRKSNLTLRLDIRANTIEIALIRYNEMFPWLCMGALNQSYPLKCDSGRMLMNIVEVVRFADSGKTKT